MLGVDLLPAEKDCFEAKPPRIFFDDDRPISPPTPVPAPIMPPTLPPTLPPTVPTAAPSAVPTTCGSHEQCQDVSPADDGYCSTDGNCYENWPRWCCEDGDGYGGNCPGDCANDDGGYASSTTSTEFEAYPDTGYYEYDVADECRDDHDTRIGATFKDKCVALEGCIYDPRSDDCRCGSKLCDTNFADGSTGSKGNADDSAADGKRSNTGLYVGVSIGAVVVILLVVLIFVMRRKQTAAAGAGGLLHKSLSISSSNFVINEAAMNQARSTENPIYTDTRDIVSSSTEEVVYEGDVEDAPTATPAYAAGAGNFESFAAYSLDAGAQPQYVVPSELQGSAGEALYAADSEPQYVTTDEQAAGQPVGNGMYEQPDSIAASEPQYVAVEAQGTGGSEVLYETN